MQSIADKPLRENHCLKTISQYVRLDCCVLADLDCAWRLDTVKLLKHKSASFAIEPGPVIVRWCVSTKQVGLYRLEPATLNTSNSKPPICSSLRIGSACISGLTDCFSPAVLL